jgi:uncharacterized SAM-binding protein YcdF (DUF218 family)
VPNRADAIVVLTGARGSRLARGLALARHGVAPVLLVSDGWGLAWVEANRLCAGRPAPVPVLCFRPDPYSTRGEARTVARLAASRRWKSVVVVTSRYHIERAGVLFDRCVAGTVYTDSAEQSFASRLTAVPLETIKLAYAFTRERC